jgi:Fe-S-cluster containining protein
VKGVVVFLVKSISKLLEDAEFSIARHSRIFIGSLVFVSRFLLGACRNDEAQIKHFPVFSCKLGHDYCGLVAAAPDEMARLPVKSDKECAEALTELSCPFLEDKGCEVYSEHPLICQLFGTTPSGSYPNACAKNRTENTQLPCASSTLNPCQIKNQRFCQDMKVVVSTAYKNAEIQSVLNRIGVEGYIEYQGRNIVKSIVVADTKWNIKIFKVPHIINKLVYRYFRKSKAQRSFEYAHTLLEKGFNSPAPIAFAEQRLGLFLLNSYYISEHLDADLSFETLLKKPQYPDRTNILQQFTEFTYNLQMAGIHFIDHSPGNTLIIKQKDQSYKFYLVDLNRMQFGPLSYQARIANFSRLSLTDEMIEIIALKYSELCGKAGQEVYADMLNICHTYTYKRKRARALKKKLRSLFFSTTTFPVEK